MSEVMIFATTMFFNLTHPLPLLGLTLRREGAIKIDAREV